VRWGDTLLMPKQRRFSGLKPRRGSSAPTTAALVLVGLALGAGLVLGTLSLSGSLSAKTVTTTITQTGTITDIVTTTLTGSTATTIYVTVYPTSSTASSANLEIEEQVCSHTTMSSLYGVTAIHGNSCLVAVTNTGGTGASFTECSIDGATETLVNAPRVVAAGTTSSKPVIAECDSQTALTPGSAVNGILVEATGAPLAFNAIVGN
jgi:hypothetical protein